MHGNFLLVLNTPRIIIPVIRRSYASWTESRVPYSGRLSEGGQKSQTKQGIDSPLNCHESFIIVKMVQWIQGSIVQIHLRHPEVSQDWLIHNLSGGWQSSVELQVTRWPFLFHLESLKSTVYLLKLSLVVVHMSRLLLMLGVSRSRVLLK